MRVGGGSCETGNELPPGQRVRSWPHSFDAGEFGQHQRQDADVRGDEDSRVIDHGFAAFFARMAFSVK